VQLCLQGFIAITKVSHSENTLRHVALFYLILPNTERFFRSMPDLFRAPDMSLAHECP